MQMNTNPTPLGTSKKPRAGGKPLKVRAATGDSELKLPCGAHKVRRETGQRSETASGGPKVAPNSQRRTGASPTAPKPPTQRSGVKPGNQKPSSPAVETKCSQQRAHGQQQLPSTKQSHAAFTVIAPDIKKRLEIQKKAEVELTALKELRLSKATTYVSITPSAVGGCLSLDEVRQKQQQEMTRTKRKPKTDK